MKYYISEIIKIPEKLIGLYIYYDNKNKPLYVGASKDIKKRLIQHAHTNKKNSNCILFDKEGIIKSIREEPSSTLGNE